MYPLNYIVIEKDVLVKTLIHKNWNNIHQVIDSPSSELNKISQVFPLKMMYSFNNIIITETKLGTFFYLKNRYSGETNKNYNVSELNNHIRRIHMHSGKPLTLYDKCYMKVLSFIKGLSI